MQNIHDFEERIHTSKTEIAAILAGKRAKEQGTNLQAATYICGRCQSASAALKNTKPVTRKERTNFNAEVKIEEEKALKLWAKKSNLWIEESQFNAQYIYRYFAEGAEQKVFLKEEGKTVIKINTGHFHATWLDFFNRLILHASLFAEISYTLTGFTQEGENLSAIIEQSWVKAIRGATRHEIETYLLQLGFIHIRYNDYYNKEQGILLEDLHDENVFIGIDENILFVDPVIYLETPDLGLNGPSQFHFPF